MSRIPKIIQEYDNLKNEVGVPHGHFYTVLVLVDVTLFTECQSETISTITELGLHPDSTQHSV